MIEENGIGQIDEMEGIDESSLKLLMGLIRKRDFLSPEGLHEKIESIIKMAYKWGYNQGVMDNR